MEYCTGNPRKITRNENGKKYKHAFFFGKNLGTSRKDIPRHITVWVMTIAVNVRGTKSHIDAIA